MRQTDSSESDKGESRLTTTRRSLLRTSAAGATTLALGAAATGTTSASSHTIQCNRLVTSTLDSSSSRTGPPLPSGASLPGDNDERLYERYRFSLDSAEKLYIEMNAGRGPVDGSNAADSYLVLQKRRGGAWKTVDYDDDSGPGNAAYIERTAGRGRFRLIATQYFTTDTQSGQNLGGVDPMEYTLALLCGRKEHDGNRIPCNYLLTSELDAANDPRGPPGPLPGTSTDRLYETWRFRLSESDRITLLMNADRGPVAQSNAADSLLALQKRRAGGWRTVEYDDDSGPGNAAIIERSVSEGRFRVVATQYYTSADSTGGQLGGVDQMPYSLALLCRDD